MQPHPDPLLDKIAEAREQVAVQDWLVDDQGRVRAREPQLHITEFDPSECRMIEAAYGRDGRGEIEPLPQFPEFRVLALQVVDHLRVFGTGELIGGLGAEQRGRLQRVLLPVRVHFPGPLVEHHHEGVAAALFQGFEIREQRTESMVPRQHIEAVVDDEGGQRVLELEERQILRGNVFPGAGRLHRRR
ncbi:hypothetical protein GCM10010094_43280 [Streptomyces flaveus]|uniref:Uncharacterized protein n=1 Tax=Streptomyces flaveus TaxID=66370 RepID=A0A917VHD4_9ACTN|nr:hypothetical protein GCM10010094_43280 [Streptomyces flaveus]